MVQITIDRADWNREFARLKEWEPEAARSLRRNMKAVGDDTLKEIRKTVLRPPLNDVPDLTRGSREAIARQTRFVVNFTKRSAGVRFTTTAGKLGTFIHAYNTGSFRHPVFGRRGPSYPQSGRPYFGVVLTNDRVTKLTARMSAVIDDANKAIGAKF